MKYLIKIIFICLGCLAVSCWLGSETVGTDDHLVKIRVRVLDEGTPINDLQKDDFGLWINSRSQAITEFDLVREKMSALPEEETTPRSFLFIFDLFGDHLQAGKILESIFDRILDDRDQLIVLINHKIIGFDPPTDKKLALQSIINMIIREGGDQMKKSATDIQILNKSIDYLRENTQTITGENQATRSDGKIHRHYYMKYFKSYLERYVQTIRTYNQNYLLPDIHEYSRLLASVNPAARNIWAFQFFEIPDLPELSKKNRALITKMRNDLSDRDWTEAWMDELDYSNKINRLLADIDSALKVTGDFETESLINLLNNRNVSLYSIYVPGNNQSVPQDPDSLPVRSAITEKWKEIALASGGDFSNQLNVQAGMMEWIDSEKIFYVLSATVNPRDIEKITITVHGHHYQVIHDQPYSSIPVSRNGQAGSPEQNRIEIQDFQCKNRRLSFSLSNFRKYSIDARAIGKINVRIQLKDDKNRNQYSKEKNFTSGENIIHISIDFKSLPESTCSGVIEVTDLVAGETLIKFFSFG